MLFGRLAFSASSGERSTAQVAEIDMLSCLLGFGFAGNANRGLFSLSCIHRLGAVAGG
jgi:hypothetical protein